MMPRLSFSFLSSLSGLVSFQGLFLRELNFSILMLDEGPPASGFHWYGLLIVIHQLAIVKEDVLLNYHLKADLDSRWPVMVKCA